MANSSEATGSPTDTPTERVRGSVLTGDLSFLLARANALALNAANVALAEHGLRARSYAVLALAADGTRPSQRDLAAFLRLDPSQVVALVDELQDRGLVRREPDPADRRTNIVVATSEGRDLFALAQQATSRAEHELHDYIGPEQRARLGELLLLLAFPD